MLTEPQLTTGWEREVAVGDTLLRRFLYHHAALGAAFTLAGGGRGLDADDVSMADLGRPCGFFNGAVLLRPPDDWDGVLTRIERFLGGGLGQAHLWSAWPTPDLHRRGWRLSGHPPLLVRPPLSTNPVSTAPVRSVDVRAVACADELADWERAAIDGYPLAELRGAAVAAFAPPTLLGDERLHLFVAQDESGPVAAAASFASHGIASLAFSATLPAARRQGLWQRLALERLRTTPNLWTAGVFSDHSRPGAESIGFVPVLRLTLWILDRA